MCVLEVPMPSMWWSPTTRWSCLPPFASPPLTVTSPLAGAGWGISLGLSEYPSEYQYIRISIWQTSSISGTYNLEEPCILWWHHCMVFQVALCYEKLTTILTIHILCSMMGVPHGNASVLWKCFEDLFQTQFPSLDYEQPLCGLSGYSKEWKM